MIGLAFVVAAIIGMQPSDQPTVRCARNLSGQLVKMRLVGVVKNGTRERVTFVSCDQVDPAKAVTAKATGTPDTVFVGQQATYRISVYIDEVIARQRAQSPTFTPPDLRGTISYDLPGDVGLPGTMVIGGRTYRPHVYSRAIFPLTAGNHVVPAAMLDYSLPTNSGYLRLEEKHSIRTDSVVIVAIAPPTAGRPDGYNGAVGDYRLERTISNYSPRIGDPFTLRVRVAGVGNIKLLPRPDLRVEWADVLPGAEHATVEVVDGNVGGVKEFEWLLTPKEAGVQQFPELQYAYFDPRTRRYRVATSDAESVEVLNAPAVAAADSAANTRAAAPIRSKYLGESPRYVFQDYLLPLAALAVPLPALLLVGFRRLQEARARSKGRDDRRETLGLTGANTAERARRTFLTSIESRLKLEPGTASNLSYFRAALLRSGVSRETTQQAVALVSELDAAVFGAGKGSEGALSKRVADCIRMIDAEAVRVPSGRSLPRMGVLMVIAIAALQQGAAEPAQEFARGVELYKNASYSEAAETFLRITQSHPRSSEAWLNLGSAAWEGGDTAAAILSWHRAIRLSPSSSDARANLASAGRMQEFDSGWIAPVHPNITAGAGLLLWTAVWIVILVQLLRKRPLRLRLLSLAGVVAVALGVVAWESNRRLSDRTFAVVAREAMSRSLPSLAAEPMTRLVAGEVVRISATESGWARVATGGRNVGWLHGSDVLRIAID